VREQAVEKLRKEHSQRERELTERLRRQYATRDKELALREKDLAAREKDISRREKAVAKSVAELASQEKQSERRQKVTTLRDQALSERAKELTDREKELERREQLYADSSRAPRRPASEVEEARVASGRRTPTQVVKVEEEPSIARLCEEVGIPMPHSPSASKAECGRAEEEQPGWQKEFSQLVNTESAAEATAQEAAIQAADAGAGPAGTEAGTDTEAGGRSGSVDADHMSHALPAVQRPDLLAQTYPRPQAKRSGARQEGVVRLDVAVWKAQAGLTTGKDRQDNGDEFKLGRETLQLAEWLAVRAASAAC